MITITVPFDNPLNQKTYENLINTLQFHQLQCTCGHSGCLTIHGYYPRSLKENDSEITLSICRVKCSHCGKTHALLPSQLVPYSQVSLQEQAAIISAYEDTGDLSFPSRLVKLCFSLFMNQFMQIRQTPNILFHTPT